MASSVIRDNIWDKYYICILIFLVGNFLFIISTIFSIRRKVLQDWGLRKISLSCLVSVILVGVVVIAFNIFFSNCFLKQTSFDCICNLKMLENGLEMYDMDHKSLAGIRKSTKTPYVKIAIQLTTNGYFCRMPKCPFTENSEVYSYVYKKNQGFVVECKIHGTISQPRYKQ